MIFNLGTTSALSEALLKETGSNWLLKETDKLNRLSLDYIDKDGHLKSRLLYFESDGWKTSDEVKTDDEAEINDETKSANETNDNSKLPVDALETQIKQSTIENLHACILKILISLNKYNEVSWLWSTNIRLLPEENEITQQSIYNHYLKDDSHNKATEEPLGLFDFNYENWIHRLALSNCLLDKRLYPSSKYVNGSQKSTIPHNSKIISRIKEEFIKFLKNEKPELDHSLRQHPYYKEIVKKFPYLVRKLIEELSPQKIEENKTIINEYNAWNKKIEAAKNDSNNNSNNNKVSKPIENKVSPESPHVYIATCIGDKPFQEDTAFGRENIKLHSSWEYRIPELLMYVVQTVAKEIYQDFSSESAEQSVGSTLSLVFIHNGFAYIAWLGDSHVIKVNKTDSQTLQAEYQIWPHCCNNKDTSRAVLVKQEEDRIKEEGGSLIPIPSRVTPGKFIYRLNGWTITTRGIGDRNILGAGITDIPSVTVVKLKEDDALIVSSDGFTDHTLRSQVAEVVQKTKIEEVARVCCSTAYNNAPKGSADNIAVIFLPKPQNGTLVGLFDGHGNKGHIIAEALEKRLPETFKKIAEMEAPSPVLQNPVVNLTKYSGTLFPEKRTTSSLTPDLTPPMEEEISHQVKREKIDFFPDDNNNNNNNNSLTK